MSSTQVLTTIPEIPSRQPEINYHFIVDNINFIIDKKRLKYVVTPEMKQCIGYCTKNKIILHPTKKIYYASFNDCPVDHPEPEDIKRNENIDKEEKSSDTYDVTETIENAKTYGLTEQKFSICAKNDYYVNNSGKGFIDIIPDFIIKTNEILDIYGITSYNKGLEYIKYNETDNLRTKLRVMDCLWKVYSTNINNVTDTFVDFYTNVAKKLWAPDLYKKFHTFITVETIEVGTSTSTNKDLKKPKYIGVSLVLDDKIIYIKKNNQEFSYYKKEKINFFVSKFINQSRIYEFLKVYLNAYQNSINDRTNDFLYMKSMKTFFKKFVKSKILYMLN